MLLGSGGDDLTASYVNNVCVGVQYSYVCSATAPKENASVIRVQQHDIHSSASAYLSSRAFTDRTDDLYDLFPVQQYSTTVDDLIDLPSRADRFLICMIY